VNRLARDSLEAVADFYDARKVGDVGPLGFRRSSDLHALLSCLYQLHARGLLNENCSFLDMGCADGRVNVLMSYFVKVSVGIEIDQWILDEYGPLRKELNQILQSKGLLLPPPNIHLFHGDASDPQVYRRIKEATGKLFNQFDFFYTYLVMHEEFSQFISQKAKSGAIFMVYGLGGVLPRYQGLELLKDLSPMDNILGLYRKR